MFKSLLLAILSCAALQAMDGDKAKQEYFEGLQRKHKAIEKAVAQELLKASNFIQSHALNHPEPLSDEELRKLSNAYKQQLDLFAFSRSLNRQAVLFSDRYSARYNNEIPNIWIGLKKTTALNYAQLKVRDFCPEYPNSRECKDAQEILMAMQEHMKKYHPEKK